MTDHEPADLAGRLRVARACLLGIKECVADLEGFLNRGLTAIDGARTAAGAAGIQDRTRVRNARRKGRRR